MKRSTLSERGADRGPFIAWWRGVTSGQRSCILLVFVLAVLICLGGMLLTVFVGGRVWSALTAPEEVDSGAGWPPDSAVLTIAVSPGMAPTLETLADTFNRLYYFERAAETYIRALQTGQPLAVLPDEIAEKTARELEDYPEQDARHLAELRAILDAEGSDYAA